MIGEDWREGEVLWQAEDVGEGVAPAQGGRMVKRAAGGPRQAPHQRRRGHVRTHHRSGEDETDEAAHCRPSARSSLHPASQIHDLR